MQATVINDVPQTDFDRVMGRESIPAWVISCARDYAVANGLDKITVREYFSTADYRKHTKTCIVD